MIPIVTALLIVLLQKSNFFIVVVLFSAPHVVPDRLLHMLNAVLIQLLKFGPEVVLPDVREVNDTAFFVEGSDVLIEQIGEGWPSDLP